MTNDTKKQCKSKGCLNPVLKGNYCELCSKKRKEKRDLILGGLGSAAIISGGVAIKKGAIKQIPKVAANIVKIFLKM